MHDTFYHNMNLVVFMAGIIALCRFPTIARDYYPFLYCLWAGCANELLSLVAIRMGHQTVVNNNIYVLLESILLTFLFDNLGFFYNRTWLFRLLLVLLPTVWFTETMIQGLDKNAPYFRVATSAAFVLLSISKTNELIFSTSRIITNSVFLLCVGFIIYFAYKALLQGSAIYCVTNPKLFKDIYVYHAYINFFTNVLYFIAVLCIPRQVSSIVR